MITLEVGKCYTNRLGHSDYIKSTWGAFFVGAWMTYNEDGTAALSTRPEDHRNPAFSRIIPCYDLVSEITIKGDVIRARIAYIEHEIRMKESAIDSLKQTIKELTQDLQY